MADEEVSMSMRFEIVKAYIELLEPMEGELLREPIPDADVPCPRCGGRSWLRVEWRAEPEQPFTRWRALACASCGAADGQQQAGRMRPDRGVPEPDWEAEQLFAGQRPSLEEVCEAARFTVYASGDRPVLRSYGEVERQITSVGVAERGIEVTTALRDKVVYGLPFDPRNAEHTARERLAWQLAERNDRRAPRLSPDAEQLHDADTVRRSDDAAASAELVEREIAVDGEHVLFAYVEQDRSWAAVAYLEEHVITITGRGTASRRLQLHAI